MGDRFIDRVCILLLTLRPHAKAGNTPLLEGPVNTASSHTALLRGQDSKADTFLQLRHNLTDTVHILPCNSGSNVTYSSAVKPKA